MLPRTRRGKAHLTLAAIGIITVFLQFVRDWIPARASVLPGFFLINSIDKHKIKRGALLCEEKSAAYINQQDPEAYWVSFFGGCDDTNSLGAPGVLIEDVADCLLCFPEGTNFELLLTTEELQSVPPGYRLVSSESCGPAFRGICRVPAGGTPACLDLVRVAGVTCLDVIEYGFQPPDPDPIPPNDPE